MGNILHAIQKCGLKISALYEKYFSFKKVICIIVWTQCTYVLVRHCCNAGLRHRRTSDQTTPHLHPPSQRSTLLNKGCLNYLALRRRFRTAVVARHIKQVSPVPYKETRPSSVMSVSNGMDAEKDGACLSSTAGAVFATSKQFHL